MNENRPTENVRGPVHTATDGVERARWARLSGEGTNIKKPIETTGKNAIVIYDVCACNTVIKTTSHPLCVAARGNYHVAVIA